MWSYLTGGWLGGKQSNEREQKYNEEEEVDDVGEPQQQENANWRDDFVNSCEPVQGALNLYQVEEDMFVSLLKNCTILLLEPKVRDTYNSNVLTSFMFLSKSLIRSFSSKFSRWKSYGQIGNQIRFSDKI